MKRAIATLRSATTIMAMLVIGATLSQASTLAYFVDIFSGAAMSGPLATPLTNAQLTTLAQAALQKNAPVASMAISIPKFNPNMDAGFIDTLTSVTFLLATVAVADVDATNTNPFHGYTFTGLSGSVPLTVSEVGGSGLVISQQPSAGPVNGAIPAATPFSLPLFVFGGAAGCIANGGVPVGANCVFYQSVTAGSFDLPGVLGNANNFSNPNTIINNLGQYIAGAGFVQFNALTQSFQVGATGCCVPTPPGPPAHEVNFGANGTVGGEIQVIYNYTQTPSAVPEPTSMILIGSSILGLGFVLRRRARKS